MFKVGIVGVGYVGNIHLTKFSTIEGVEITAIQDKDAKSIDHAKANFDVKTTYKCHKHLLKNEVLDLVVICVPNHLHAELTIEALESGHNVLCEKPMALNLKDAKSMIKAADQNQKLLLVVNNFRWDYFNPSIFKLKNLIDSKWFGRIYHIKLQYLRNKTFSPELYSRWNLDFEFSGGGALIDLGPHIIDLGMWLASDYSTLSVSGSVDAGLLKRERIDDFATGLIKLKSNCTLQIDLSWSGHSRSSWKIDVHGDKRSASIGSVKDRNPGLKVFKWGKEEIDQEDIGAFTSSDLPEKSLQEHIVKTMMQGEESLCTAKNAYSVLNTITQWYDSSKD